VGTAPTLLYFGQEVGEPGAEDAGFGKSTRTSIFDYVGVPHHQRWMNGGKFDGGQLTASEQALRDFYKRLLNLTIRSAALTGSYSDLHAYNRAHTTGYSDHLFSFARWSAAQKLVVVSNFSNEETFTGTLQIPETLIQTWQLKDGRYPLQEELYGNQHAALQVTKGIGNIRLKVAPLESVVLSIR